MNESDNNQEALDEDAKCKQKSRGKKRKRIASSSDEDPLPENTLEMEKNLHASALKNNLDDVSVKKILKKVVTNDHVLALVKMREEEEDSGTEENLRPKLTRAKAKELMKVSPKSATWNLELTPIKHIPVKTRPEVKALIAQELPEDEDDDEYEPNNDDVPSDDDHVLEMSSDVDSLPRTPATPRKQREPSPVAVTDGPFKVPQQLSTPVRKTPTSEEATIALRTRSKLSLSSTSIEHIESSFVPPDDLPTPDVDSLWNEFLKDCLNPAASARHEDDDEADPEYNVAADPDANDEDEESLENSIIKISKKELGDLVTELFSIMPDESDDQLGTGAQDLAAQVTPCSIGKQEPMSDEYSNMNDDQSTTPVAMPTSLKDSDERQQGTVEDAAQKQENPVNDATQGENVHISASTPAALPQPTQAVKPKRNKKQPPLLLSNILAPKKNLIRIEIKKGECSMTAEQRLIVEQQLRQHVQLAAGNFLQLFVHPTHWARAPKYKEYLVSLNGMVEKNPGSVVNVCNLRPALELVSSWEESLSVSTEENLKIVAFIEKEMEKSRRRTSQHSTYVGQFPQTFLETVANSSVFLYPYLLPAMPYRPDVTHRRAAYLLPEDQLIALGLDQFKDYLEANPDVYATAKPHPRHRCALAQTIDLVHRHMLPWLSAKTLFCHVRLVKRNGDQANPIHKFFATGKVDPVKHRLLPFNPRLTLYEQPEHEMPRLWLRHLAKSSQRFKRHLHSRNKPHVTPVGVDVEMNTAAPVKVPLPIDFTKEINCNRLNLLPKKPELPLVGRIDVPIASQSAPNALMPSDLYTVVQTSNGSYLIPLAVQATTTNTNPNPINTPSEKATIDKSADITNETLVTNDRINVATTDNVHDDERSAENTGKNEDSLHCSCCVLLRHICFGKKWTIPDYFKRAGGSERCDCTGRRYPRMTKRLRYLLLNYKVRSQCLFKELQRKIGSGMGGSDTSDSPSNLEDNSRLICDDNEERDLVDATLFQLKLTMTAATVRNNHTKCRIRTLFQKFDIENDDAIGLAQDLFKACNDEMVPLYKEFVGFLTADQADRLGFYKDYFIERCLKNLIAKIEELVADKERRIELLSYLQSRLFSAQFHKWPACDICTALLDATSDLPALARHVFAMFPHRAGHSIPTKVLETPAVCVEKPTVSQAAVNNEIEDTPSREDYENSEKLTEAGTATPVTEDTPLGNTDNDTLDIVKIEMDVEEETDKEQQTTEASCDASEMSRLVMSEDEMVKTECPEWKREEDKVILEVLKDHIAPEERKDKTILEVLEETQVLSMISDHLPSKSVHDVKLRILYLLHLLVGEVQ